MTLKEENDNDDTAADRESESSLVELSFFVKNQKLFNLACVEQLGSLKRSQTRARHSSADGEGIKEAIAGLEAQLVVTTRNAKGQQCHDDNDCVTLAIRNWQDDNCAAELHVQDNKDGT